MLFFSGGGGESVTVSPDEVAGWDVRALVGVLVDSVLATAKWLASIAVCPGGRLERPLGSMSFVV